KSDAGRDAAPDEAARARGPGDHGHRRAHPRSVGARTGLPRAPRLPSACARRRHHGHRPAARRADPCHGRWDRADDPRGLRPEGLGTSMKETPAIYVQGEGSYWLAHVPVLRGCIASGTTRDEAIANARRAFRAYLDLLDARGVSVEHWKDLDPKTFDVRDLPRDRVVPEDLGPLEEHELRDFLHQFEASRAALISELRGIPPEEIERKPTETMWSVREALEHVVLTRADLLSRLEKWPADPYNTLQPVHRL